VDLKMLIRLTYLLLQWAMVATSDVKMRSVALGLAKRILADAIALHDYPDEPEDFSDIPF